MAACRPPSRTMQAQPGPRRQHRCRRKCLTQPAVRARSTWPTFPWIQRGSRCGRVNRTASKCCTQPTKHAIAAIGIDLAASPTLISSKALWWTCQQRGRPHGLSPVSPRQRCAEARLPTCKLPRERRRRELPRILSATSREPPVYST